MMCNFEDEQILILVEQNSPCKLMRIESLLLLLFWIEYILSTKKNPLFYCRLVQACGFQGYCQQFKSGKTIELLLQHHYTVTAAFFPVTSRSCWSYLCCWLSMYKEYANWLNQQQHLELVQSNLVIRNKLVIRNHFPWPIANLLHKDKEHLALRNNFRLTKKFLITKFDFTIIFGYLIIFNDSTDALDWHLRFLVHLKSKQIDSALLKIKGH